MLTPQKSNTQEHPETFTLTGFLQSGGTDSQDSPKINTSALGNFSILDHLEGLDIIKESGSEIECHCPACGAKNFKIDRKTGKYFGFSCSCTDSEAGKKEIRDIVAPLPTAGKRQGRGAKTLARQVSVQRKGATPAAPIEEEISLARLTAIPSNFPTAAPCSQAPKGVPTTATQTVYRYSPLQFVIRYEWEDLSKPKGRDKTFRQFTISAEGERVWGKGEEPWPLYRESEALSAGGWVLFQEGEKCVEATRSLGLVSITLQGSNWGEDAISDRLAALQAAGVPGVVYFADNDQTGSEKSKKVEAAAGQIGFPCVTISIKDLWPDAPQGADLADWIQQVSPDMNTQDFIRRLELEIHAAVARRNQEALEKALNAEVALNLQWEALRREIKLIQQEPQSAKRKFLLSQLAQKYRLPLSVLNQIAVELAEDVVKPEKIMFSLDEILNSGTEANSWLIPGYLPQGELVLLSAAPKVGKTLLVTDIAKAALTGGTVFGETIAPCRVLYVTSDESINSMGRRLEAAGFGSIPAHLGENFRVLTHFDITYQSPLLTLAQEFRPDLVIFDSLTSISRKAGFAENDAAFAYPIYQLRDLLASVGAAGILIHHDNKNRDARNLEKVSGSLRITAAVWGSWRLELDGDDAAARKLIITPRETEGSEHRLEINPRPLWTEKGIYSYLSEVGDEGGQKRTASQQILDILASGSRLEAIEIKNLMGGYSNIYQALSRLEDRGLISRGKSTTTGKAVYFLPCTDNTPQEKEDNPPPLRLEQDDVSNKPKTVDSQEVETFNSPSNTGRTAPLTPPTNIHLNTGGGGDHDQVSPDPVPLVSEDDVPFPGPIPEDWEELKIYNKKQIAALGWTKEQARSFAKELTGVERRELMTDDELIRLTQELNKCWRGNA